MQRFVVAGVLAVAMLVAPAGATAQGSIRAG